MQMDYIKLYFNLKIEHDKLNKNYNNVVENVLDSGQNESNHCGDWNKSKHGSGRKCYDHYCKDEYLFYYLINCSICQVRMCPKC